ncbi:hypothetical protein LJR230_004442 [Trinickia sp. LjRoot230]|uniref:glycine-rich domain-containing protein n=1 Tax=Trinickia sp. LjRoot230 TaxID=3342288 RepID=UPI003ECE1C3B
MQQQHKDVATMWQAIDELDFERIKAKLVHRNHGVLTIDDAARAETGYRQFLKLAAKYPDLPVVPTEAVDEFWHMHILDTQRYASDCERIFGYMIHHDPYLGIDGGEDEVRQLELSAASHALAAREFGDASAAAPSAAFCVTSTAKQADVAFCVRPMAKQADVAFCVRPMAKQADGAFCVRPMAKQADGAFCVRPMAKQADVAFCVRPMAKQTDVAFCVRPMARQADAAFCVKPMAKQADAAFCVKPMAKQLDVTYSVRPFAPARDESHTQH